MVKSATESRTFNPKTPFPTRTICRLGADTRSYAFGNQRAFSYESPALPFVYLWFSRKITLHGSSTATETKQREVNTQQEAPLAG